MTREVKKKWEQGDKGKKEGEYRKIQKNYKPKRIKIIVNKGRGIQLASVKGNT
jgi:hypothetical protein